MKAFIVFFSVFVATAFAADDYCYNDVIEACKPSKKCKFLCK